MLCSCRCTSVSDPTKSDPRSSESWQGLLFRMRQLFVNAYAKVISQYESDMRGMLKLHRILANLFDKINLVFPL